jgi:hypothetical protein
MKKILIFIFSFLLPSITASAAELEFSLNKTKIFVGDKFSVKLTLSGFDSTLGTDTIILYDPKSLNVESVIPTSLYPTYNPLKDQRIDIQKGKILLSGSAGIGKPVTADGEFATINFVAQKAGTTQVKFAYQAGSTSKTGVVSPSGKELLTSEPSTLSIYVSNPSFFQKIIKWFNKVFFKK